MFKDNTYRKALFFALFLHIILFGFLFIKFSTHHNYVVTNRPEVNIVKAVTVNQNEIEKQIAQIKAKQKQKEEQELARVRYLQKQALAAKIRREQEQKKLVKIRAEAKKRQQEEMHRKKLLALKTKQEQEQKLKAQEEAKRRIQIQKAMQQQIAQEQKQMAVNAEQIQGEIDKYKTLIIAAISQHWIIPDNVAKGISCQLLVHVAHGGKVLSIDLVRSSGNDVLDRSARTAVLKASPLPVPKDAELFDNFRLLRLTVRPEGIVG